jgi:hypothetical protein
MPERLPDALELLAPSKDAVYEQKAYIMCVQAEAHYAPEHPGDLACVRLIGWMLQKAPSAEVRDSIAREILENGLEDNVENVRTSGVIYVGHYIRICAW